MAATTSFDALTSTPPPPSTLRTPPTPRHAGDYEAYSSPRKSSRLSSQRAQKPSQTPPPPSRRTNRASTLASPPSTTKRTSSARMPDTPPLTITKKRVQASSDSRRVSGSLTADTAAFAASALGLPSKNGEASEARPGLARNVLPTPDKTPRKTTNKSSAGLSFIARTLFPVRPENIDEVMPSPRKKKSYAEFTLDGASAEEEPIAIFTDSHERVPEVDTSEDNPFYNPKTAVPEPIKRASKRRKITVPGEGEQSLEDAAKREDGMVYTFRGKKFWRKFDDKVDEQEADDEEQLDGELDPTIRPRLRGSLSKSAIKPRVLFPAVTVPKRQSLAATDEDEEAATDIEATDSEATEVEEVPVETSTPAELEEHIATPAAPRFAPASPPVTGRTTRSKKVQVAPAPHPITIKRSAAKMTMSPFADLPRTKVTAVADSKKRDAETAHGADGPIKRRRSEVHS